MTVRGKIRADLVAMAALHFDGEAVDEQTRAYRQPRSPSRRGRGRRLWRQLAARCRHDAARSRRTAWRAAPAGRSRVFHPAARPGDWLAHRLTRARQARAGGHRPRLFALLSLSRFARWPAGSPSSGPLRWSGSSPTRSRPMPCGCAAGTTAPGIPPPRPSLDELLLDIALPRTPRRTVVCRTAVAASSRMTAADAALLLVAGVVAAVVGTAGGTAS